MRMTFTMVFPLLVGFLELVAGIVYLAHKQYALAATWIFYALACVGLAIAGR